MLLDLVVQSIRYLTLEWSSKLLFLVWNFTLEWLFFASSCNHVMEIVMRGVSTYSTHIAKFDMKLWEKSSKYFVKMSSWELASFQSSIQICFEKFQVLDLNFTTNTKAATQHSDLLKSLCKSKTKITFLTKENHHSVLQFWPRSIEFYESYNIFFVIFYTLS